jgi:quercetin dioxygenase-like cupin family protein
VFFEFQAGFQLQPHSHCAQWGVVVNGDVEFNIGGETQVCRNGDTYLIPAGVTHHARFRTLSYVIDVFDDPARYKVPGLG